MVNNLSETLRELGMVVLMPTYNNQATLKRVIDGVLEHVSMDQLIVINDGATDETATILAAYSDKITVLTHPKNQGKGKALRTGFRYAIEQGFTYALTIDSDGQHYPDDIGLLVEAVQKHPHSCVMGSRNMEQEGVPGKSSFGNKFSNFWFLVETGIKLPDTQTGFRVYPLEKVKKLWLLTRKFELEIEVIVKLAWRNVHFIPVPIRVKYDPTERVSHFRPGRDFFRISVLNTFLVLISLIWFYPRLIFRKKTWAAILYEAVKPEESNLRKSLSLGFGVFMGIVPLWGFQLLIGIPLAILFRLNKVLFITAANISIPPMIPFILFGSFALGQIIMTGHVNYKQLLDLKLETIGQNFLDYVVGACALAVLAGGFTTGLSWLLFSFFRKNPKNN